MATASTVKRALDVLDLFVKNKAELGVTEVALELGMTKSTAHRLMITLEEANILKKLKNKPKYFLGPKILELAQTFLSKADLRTISYPYLKELNSKTGEATSVYIREGNERVCLDRIDSIYSVRHILKAGDHGPLHAGSPGKILLSGLSNNEIQQIITATGLPRYTDHTVSSMQQLEEDIAKVRKEGVAFSFAEHINLLAAASAPIRKYGGEIIASLGITWVTDNPDPVSVNKYLGLVKEAADNISREMGYMNLSKEV